MHNRIGWIGLGRIGEAVVKRLAQAGHGVTVWNRTAAKADPLVAYGVTVAASRQELASCETVFTMVSTTEDLKQVLFAADGLVAGNARPEVVIDSSSISQEGSAEIRERLEGMGVAYLCAPVSGNAKVAKAGKLLVVASGPRHVFLESINDSVLGSMYTRYKTPVLTNLDFDRVTFTPRLLLKDMDLGLGAAKAHGVAMPAAAATRESVARMVGRGHDDIDFEVLLLETARDAGLELVPEDVQVSDGLQI